MVPFMYHSRRFVSWAPACGMHRHTRARPRSKARIAPGHCAERGWRARRRAQEQAQASSRLAAQRAALAAMFALPRPPAMRCHTACLHPCAPGDPLDRVRRCVLWASRISYCRRPHE